MHSPAWTDFWTAAQHVDILSVAERLGAKLKRQAGDFVGPCLAGCSETDGFVITPKKSVFICRKAGVGGDVLAMVAHCRNCSRVEAAEFATGHDRPDGRKESDEQRAESARRRQATEIEAAKRLSARERLDALRLVRDGEAVASILERAVSFPGSRAEDYMLDRGAGMPKSMTRDLRFVEELHYWGYPDHAVEERVLLTSLPAMVAIIRALDGEIVGVHITYLDPKAPRKFVAPWEADLDPKLRRNPAKKFRSIVEKLNGAMIRLGVISDAIVLGEGLETTGSYFRRGFAPEDASFGVAMSIDNLCGGSVAQIDHPTKRAPNGKPTSIPNGIPDPEKPGVLLPPYVKRVILLGDGDSDPFATRAKLMTAGRRYRAEGREAFVDMAIEANDFASMGAEFEAGRVS